MPPRRDAVEIVSKIFLKNFGPRRCVGVQPTIAVVACTFYNRLREPAGNYRRVAAAIANGRLKRKSLPGEVGEVQML